MVEKIPLNSPRDGISKMDEAVFGTGCRRHPVLGFVVSQSERGPSIEHQVWDYLRQVERDHGKAVADHLRAKLQAAGLA
jgi:hypothetical protein